jgi:hypothetical protein
MLSRFIILNLLLNILFGFEYKQKKLFRFMKKKARILDHK